MESSIIKEQLRHARRGAFIRFLHPVGADGWRNLSVNSVVVTAKEPIA